LGIFLKKIEGRKTNTIGLEIKIYLQCFKIKFTFHKHGIDNYVLGCIWNEEFKKILKKQYLRMECYNYIKIELKLKKYISIIFCFYIFFSLLFVSVYHW
jgi:late competence protein required for DNA uptake (superfamily II DNA/RNA helicase)